MRRLLRFARLSRVGQRSSLAAAAMAECRFAAHARLMPRRKILIGGGDEAAIYRALSTWFSQGKIGNGRENDTRTP